MRFSLLAMLSASFALAQSPAPSKGYIPDETTAVTVAEAILSPIYGKSQIEGERPFHATLKKDVWEVTGTLPVGWDGGTAMMRISKRTGAVLSYTHYK